MTNRYNTALNDLNSGVCILVGIAGGEVTGSEVTGGIVTGGKVTWKVKLPWGVKLPGVKLPGVKLPGE